MRGRPDLRPNRGQGAHKAEEALRVFRVGDEVNGYEEVRPVDGVSDVSQGREILNGEADGVKNRDLFRAGAPRAERGDSEGRPEG